MNSFSSTIRLSGALAAVLTVIALWFEPAVASAQRVSSGVSQTKNVRAELVAEVASVSPGASFWVALRLDIRDGRHTYWRNPGDSGEPTRIRWSLPAGVTASDIHWPFPRRIPYGPLVNYGYENRVLHLVRMQVDDRWTPGPALEATADASWLVCEDICIPEAASFRLSLPAAAGPTQLDPAAAAEIDRARARLPARPPVPARVEVSEDSLVLDVAVGVDGAKIGSASFFPYEWGYVEPAGAQELEVRGDRLILKMVRGENVVNGVVKSRGCQMNSMAPAQEVSLRKVTTPPSSMGTSARRDSRVRPLARRPISQTMNRTPRWTQAARSSSKPATPRPP